MPAADSGVGGQPYTVSDKILQREGYEFLGWTLDYGVANTYTLTYQVTGDPTCGVPGDTTTPDPVTGIREGSSVTLTNALSTAWVTGDGSPAPTTASYTVYYIDNATNVELCPSINVGDKPIGSTVTEDARDLSEDGYQLVSDTPKSLTLKPNVEGKWTFTGWCSDEDCTQPISEVTNISADTTVYGKWVYSETENNNEITFYYEEQAVQYVTYTVKYVEEITEMQLHKPETKTVPYGTTVTEYPVPIEVYTAVDNKISCTIYGGEVIVFEYYTVNEDI